MDVVGHDAPGVDGHVVRGGVTLENIDRGGSDGRGGEDGPTSFDGDGDRAHGVDVGIAFRCKPDTSTLSVSVDH